jgi:hypothetical protein
VQPTNPLVTGYGQGFRNPIIRSLQAGNSSGGRIVIGANIPAELTTYYVTNYNSTPVVVQLFYINATDYYYIMESETGAAERATGWGIKNTNTSLMEVWQETVQSFPDPSVPARASVLYTDPIAGHGPILSMDANSTFTIEPAATFQIDDIDAPRGLIGSIANLTDSAAIAGTETVVLTLTSRTYAANRAYLAVFGNRSQGDTAANTARFRLRKANATGTLLVDYGSTPHPIVGQDMNACGSGHFVTGAAATRVVVLTLQRGAGAGNVNQVGTSTPRFVTIYDVGNAANYDSSFPTLT